MDIHTLNQSLRRIEQLITRPAESLDDPEERQAEFVQRLERTRRLMAKLGNPQSSLDIIHIGGTSGKGSTAILCEAMLRASGLRVGTHTSPYLQTPLEKVRVDGRLVDPQQALVLVERVLGAVGALQADDPGLGNPHYAEAWLGLALRHFADENCRVGVVEVGMGGRYDATNIVTPRVSVICTVHYDHTRVLGEELEDIAYHKAGIIKGGVPVVVGHVPPEAWEVIQNEAIRCGSRIIRLGGDVRAETLSITRQGSRFNYRGLGLALEDAHVSLLGGHQIANAAAALAAVETYAGMQGISLDPEALRAGLASARFAGRLEMMQSAPMVVLDGAHNEEKIGALTAALPEVFDYPRLILVAGMLETKAIDPIVQRLASVADAMITTSPSVKGKPAIAAETLAEAARRAGLREVYAEAEPLDALEKAIRLSGPDDLVVVTGSLYLIGRLRSYWHPTDKIVSQRTTFPNGYPEG